MSSAEAIHSTAVPGRRRSGKRPYVHWTDGGRGPILVLLNGWSASGAVWPRAFVRRLERSFRVVRIDNRGTGFSRAAPAPFTMRDLARDVVDVLDEIGTRRATVVGLSMGGMIAQELALTFPQHIENVVLVGTQPPAPEHRSGGLAAIALMKSPGREALDAYFRRLWSTFCAPGFADANPGSIDETVAQVLERVTPRSTTRHQARAVAGWCGARRLRRLTTACTVVHGEVDPLLPVCNGMRLAQLVPGARYTELLGVGHLVPVEAPDALCDIIERAAR